MYLWRRVQWHIHIYHSTFFLKLNTLQIFELKRKHVHKKEEIIFVGVNELGELKFVWVGKWIKQIVGQASFVMNACTCFTQFSYIVSHYRHQPTSSSWLCEVERLYHRILLYTETTINHRTVNHNDFVSSESYRDTSLKLRYLQSLLGYESPCSFLPDVDDDMLLLLRRHWLQTPCSTRFWNRRLMHSLHSHETPHC